MASKKLLVALFATLCIFMVAALLFTIAIDGLPFRKELLTPWMAATLVDFYIHVLALAAWVLYKEANWISSTVCTILLICFGSITTCAYVVVQFMKLSSQESSQDPMYYVLLRYTRKVGMEDKRCQSLVFLRILFGTLGCLMLGTLVYTLLTDGSPFRRELFTPWMTATLIDFYINVVALSVWVVYKERNWVCAILWILLLICFGSITTCAYITWQLFQITSQDPIYLVLLPSNDRAGNRFKTLDGETVHSSC